MTNVSKRKLSPKNEAALVAQLSALFTKRSAAHAEAIVDSLLGYEERVMLAKRFAVIVLLLNEKPIAEIARLLHMSTATVSSIAAKESLGQYDDLKALFEKPTASIVRILDRIDSVLHLGGALPHYGQTYRSEAYLEHKRASEKRSLSVNRKARR